MLHKTAQQDQAVTLNADQVHMDRRRLPRRKLDLTMTAIFSDGSDRRGVVPLEITDTSPLGLGCLSPTLLEPGMSITLCTGQVPIRTGTIVRCENEGVGYRLGLRFAAAKSVA